jgi:RNA polymerase sigma factor (sigma-70 family)
MTSDLDLLRQFAREDSQEAFREIVRRHLNLVYSAALRQVHSPQLAEEVAQSVFADLARDARKLKPDTILTAWLYTVARRTAIDALRRESRRQLREHVAMEMNAMNATADDWAQIAPLLDDAMAALEETDRAAILLRYFENKSLREVGESLAISDDAAQKRVSRAVDSLRAFFTKEKLTVGAAAVTALISANAVQSAPVGLTATISAALAGTAVQTSTLMVTTKTIAVTTLQKSLITAALAMVAGAGIYAAHKNAGLRDEMQSLQQQQAPLTAQLAELQTERDDATNQVAGLLAENSPAEAGSKAAEILRLRREVSQLETAANQREKDPEAPEAKAWLNRANRLKDYLAQHPEEKIPELQFLEDKDWLTATDGEGESTNELENAVQRLKFDAENKIGTAVEEALSKYSEDNNGKFPDTLSELQPYCSPDIGSILQQLYEIAPSSIVHDTPSKFGGSGVTIRYDTPPNLLGQWIITRKVRPNPTSTTRLAIFYGGFTSWQSPPGSDNSQ